MNKLIEDIEKLKDSSVKRVIDSRIEEFKDIGKDSDKVFKELCFCLLTANFNAERGINIQENICDGFLTLPEKRLAKRLKELGHRYPNVRARYIVEAREHKLELNRNWVVENVKGLGMKEASHFLRNIGFGDYAIIDFHIVDLLVKYGLIEKPKTLSKNKYLEIENILKKLGKKVNLNLAELDLYLWYMETGKVLK